MCLYNVDLNGMIAYCVHHSTQCPILNIYCSYSTCMPYLILVQQHVKITQHIPPTAHTRSVSVRLRNI